MNKIVFIDLDGTLKNNQGQVTEATKHALQEAKSAGYEIVFTTGRSYEYVDELNKECGNVCRYTVASTGSIVYDLEKREILAVTEIPTNSAIEFCKSQNPDLIWLIHCTDGIYSTVPHDPEQNSKITKLITESLQDFLCTKKTCAMTVASHNYELIQNMQSDTKKIQNIYISNRHKALTNPIFPRRGLAYYDIVSANVSKGSGIKALCSILNIPRENRIAIGDDLNDLPMFAECGYKVAMDNAIPEIKDVANEITFDNNNDGVAKFLLALIKNKGL